MTFTKKLSEDIFHPNTRKGLYMKYATPDFVTRKGIVMHKGLVPYASALTFNAGITRFNNGYVMLFRNDYNICPKDFDDFYAGISDHTVPPTNWGLAFSSDGLDWKVATEPFFEMSGGEIWRTYDPRITPLPDGTYGVCFAADSHHGTRGGIGVTSDFKTFEPVSFSAPENRNMVLFPEKINGQFVRLERPFGSRRESIWLSSSPDLIHWGETKLVLGAEKVAFASNKIGPAAPPVKTSEGWLTLFHAVEVQEQPFSAWQRDWLHCYYAGAMLLDLDDPSKIIARAEVPLIVPEAEYELHGFRGGVIFPGGVLVDGNRVRIYYGAADTVEALAEAPLDELIRFIKDHDAENIR